MIPADRATLYRPDIDGLRALAILSVALAHAGVPALAGGFTGVDIFFVISGYLIGGHIHTELRAGSFSFLRFYQRRARRILPAFFAVLAFILLASLVLLSPQEAAVTARASFAAALSSSNILFWLTTSYFAPKSELNPLLMTWSLGVEEQFYALVPILMVLLTRLRRNWLLPSILAVCALSFAFAWVVLPVSAMFVFYMLPGRAWELGAGVALAVGLARTKAIPSPPWLSEFVSAAGLALMLAPVFLLTPNTLFPGPAALPTVIGTVLLLALPASWVNRHLLSLRPLAFTGRISYSWYLWHWPLLSLARVVCGGNLPLPIGVAAIAAAYGIAVLSYSWIEQPFRRPPFARSPLRRYAALTVAASAACAALWLSHGAAGRFSALAQIESTSQSLHSDPCLVAGQDQPNPSAACLGGNSPAVALWGDSHAAALAPGLRALAASQGYSLVELAKNSCPPLIGAAHYLPWQPRAAAACAGFNRRGLDLLVADRRVRIVVLAASWAAPLNQYWMDGWLVTEPETAQRIDAQTQAPTPEASHRLLVQALSATLQSLQAAGKQVIVLEDTPYFDFDPVLRVRGAKIFPRRKLAEWLGSPLASDPGLAAPAQAPGIARSIAALRQAVAANPGATLAGPNPALCPTPAMCAYRDGEKLLFLDNSHLTAYGSGFALRGFQFASPDTSSRLPAESVSGDRPQLVSNPPSTVPPSRPRAERPQSQ